MDPNMVRAFCAATEESMRIWCSLLRIVLMGPRLLHNYRQRLAACEMNHQSSTDRMDADKARIPGGGNSATVVDEVRHPHSLVGQRGITHQRSDRRAVDRACSVSRVAHRQGGLGCSRASLGPSGGLGASVGDLGYVSGRSDVGRPSSIGELCPSGLSVTISSTQSLNSSHHFSSLFNPLRWSRRIVNGATTEPETQQKNTTRKGPAARRCNRSTGNLHRPLSMSPSSSVFFLSQEREVGSQTSSAEHQQREFTAPLPQPTHQIHQFAVVRPQLLPPQFSPIVL